MRRYKTKQELKADRLASIKLPFGEPLDVQALSINLTTTNPHPYEGRGIIIKISNETEHDNVRDKAFALGYKWEAGDQTEAVYDNVDLCIIDGDLWTNPESGDYDVYTILTPQQFLEGYWPNQFEQDVRSAAKHYEKSNLIQEKEDAYIDISNKLHVWIGGGEAPVPVINAWKYNLMSEAEFKEKHPEQLMFKDWKVKSDPNYIRVGCESFEKPKLNEWLKISKRILGHDVSLGVAYDWISKREDILGL